MSSSLLQTGGGGSSGAVLWSGIGNAAAPLTLANDGFATTFNHTSAVAWTWANTTAATVGTPQNAPSHILSGQYFATGSVTGTDTWTLVQALTAGLNGESQLQLNHAGTTGQASLLFPSSAINVTTPAIRWSGGTSTYGIGGATTRALHCYVPGGAGNEAVGIVQAGTARFNITSGDSSTANNALTIASISANFSINLQGLNSTNVTNPAIMMGNTTTNFSATSGAQTFLGIGFGKGTSNNISFAPTSGTATFTATALRYTINQTGGANGAIKGLELVATETALGGTHKLLTFTVGATESFTILNSGKVSNYKAIATVAGGVPAEYATADLTTQSAAITATTLYAVPASGAGRYRVSFVASVTTAASTSSILGGASGFQIVYTDADDSVAKTSPRTITTGVNTDATNTTATALSGVITVNAKASTNIQYKFDYTSVGGTAMQYNLHIILEAL